MSRRRRLLLSSSLSWLVACSGDEVDVGPPEAAFEALCGQQGPVELVALADDEEVAWADRIAESEHVHVRVKVDGYVPGEPPIVRRNVVLDECGAEIAEVASEVDRLWWWNGVLLGCIEHDLVSLSGYDDPSPELLARRGCGARLEGERWLAIDAEPDATVARVVAVELAGSSVSVRELVPQARIGGFTSAPTVVDGQVFAQSPDLTLYRVDPSDPDAGLQIELAQVDEGKWSVSGDLLAYRLPAAEGEDPNPVILRDRRTGAELALGPDVPSDGFGWMGEGMFGTWSEDAPKEDWRWWRLDPLRELDVPEGTTVELQRDDGLLWLERRDPEQGVLEMLLWAEGEAPQVVWSCPSCTITVESRSSLYIERLVQTTDPDRRELWRFDTAGNPPTLLGNAMGGGAVLDDGRLLTVKVGEDDEHGPLLLIDGEDDPGVTLVENVDVASIHFTLGFENPGEIVYEARLDDGTHGLFRARLAQ